MNTRVHVGSIPFSVMGLADAVEFVFAEARTMKFRGTGPGVAIHFCNAFNVAIARSDVGYRQLIAQAAYVFSDGVPITWIGKLVRPDLVNTWERVYGPDVMTAVLNESTSAHPRHYLLGGSPEVLASLRSVISSRFPNAFIVGSESPPFTLPSEKELTDRDARIFASDATIVWVGLGTPKQDYEVARLAANLPVVAIAVGAAFDFLAGTRPQAPRWMQRSGTEWLFRLASEPRRLAKRYFWGNSVFMLEAFRTLARRS